MLVFATMYLVFLESVYLLCLGKSRLLVVLFLVVCHLGGYYHLFKVFCFTLVLRWSMKLILSIFSTGIPDGTLYVCMYILVL